LYANPAVTYGSHGARSFSDSLKNFLRDYPALAIALLASLVFHVALLAVHFTFPPRDPDKDVASTLDVVLVNSKTKSKPTKADVLAQADLDGGGNTDEDRRAKTPLPATQEDQAGDQVRRAQRRVQELEAQQRELMTKANAKASLPRNPPKAAATPMPAEVPTTLASGEDLADSALEMARLEAQISRNVEEYNKRPRKTFIGTRARESRFAMYVEQWRQKVERVGNLNYPDSARGRIYGSLRMSVLLRADGSVDSMQIDRTSGHQVLDQAAQKIVRLAAPFAAFPPDIRKDTDILVITRTWTFAPGDKVFNEE